MKLLFINMSLDPVTGGGTAERTVQLCRALLKAGHSCTILTLDIGLTAEQTKRLAGVEIIRLPCINHRFYVPAFSFKHLHQIVSYADYVHIMGHWTVLNALVYMTARKLDKPYAVCPAGALPVFGRSKLIKNIFNAAVGHAIISNAQFHVAVAGNEFAHFAKYDVPTSKVTLIPNGVDLNEFLVDVEDIDFFRRQHNLGNNPYMLFVGRLNVIKGPDILLEAFIKITNNYPEIHLVFAGPDGGMLKALEDQVASHDLQHRVHFVGHVAGTMKAAAYKSALFLVVPSRQEAMSIVALESGVSGVPVLLTDQCGFGSLSDIGGGMVVSATEMALAEGLINMLESRDTLPVMGSIFRSYILNHYTWDIAAKTYIELFDGWRIDHVS